MNLRNLCGWLAALLLLASPALAQRKPLYQDGVAVPNHLGKFNTQGHVGDVGDVNGDALGKGVAPFAVLDLQSTALCANSAVTGGQYSAFCLGHDTDNNGIISLDSYGGLAGGSLIVRINGTDYPFPAAGGGNLLGGGTTVVNNLTCWNDTVGSLVKDCGGSNGPRVTAAGGLQAYGTNSAGYTTTGSHSRFQNAPVVDADLFGLPQWNVLESRLDVPPGTSVQNVAAVGAYVVNRTPSLGATGNSVGFMSITKAAVNDAASWGINTVLNTTDAAGTGRVLSGYEADFNMAGPHDRLRGIGLFGLSTDALTSDVRDGMVVGSLSLQDPGLVTWLRGFVCDPAAIIVNGSCLDIQPDTTTAASHGGPAVNFWYTNASAVKHYFSLATSTSNDLVFNSDTGDTNGGVQFYPLVLFRSAAQWPYTVSAVEYTYSMAVDAPTHKLVVSGGTGDATVQFNTTVALAGPIQVPGMPTSCSGLPTGSVWNNAGTLKVCP